MQREQRKIKLQQFFRSPGFGAAGPFASADDKPAEATMTKAEQRWLAWFMAGYVLLFLLLYPRMYTSLDESACFGMVGVLRHGTIFPDQVGYTLPLSPLGPHGHIYRFPIGFPACLALLSFFGSWAFFVLNPACHLGATWCFAKLLRRINIPVQYAVLYLFYPGFVLYERTLFSDGFAASLTTFALYFLSLRRSAGFAGACMGLALLSRSTSLIVTLVLLAVLLAADWRRTQEGPPFLRSRSVSFVLGSAPFVILNGLYNQFANGGFFRSTYSPDMLSAHYLLVLGPLYLGALFLIFPGMLLAPFFYRGLFWREGLITTTALVLVAGSYHETTYGDNLLQTLLSVTRQILPALPFYLLAYVGVLARLAMTSPLGIAGRDTGKAFSGAGLALLLVSAGISVVHQQHLKKIVAMQTELRQVLPQRAVIYGNKDVFKLHQPLWEPTIYRDVTQLNTAQVASDISRYPVYVALSFRSRGVANEDGQNQRVLKEVQNHLVVKDGPASPSGQIEYYRVVGIKE